MSRIGGPGRISADDRSAQLIANALREAEGVDELRVQQTLMGVVGDHPDVIRRTPAGRRADARRSSDARGPWRALGAHPPIDADVDQRRRCGGGSLRGPPPSSTRRARSLPGIWLCAGPASGHEQSLPRPSKLGEHREIASRLQPIEVLGPCTHPLLRNPLAELRAGCRCDLPSSAPAIDVAAPAGAPGRGARLNSARSSPPPTRAPTRKGFPSPCGLGSARPVGGEAGCVRRTPPPRRPL